MHDMNHQDFRALLDDIRNKRSDDAKKRSEKLNEHIYPHHVCKEGENFKDCFGQEAPHIAVIKNDTGSDTGEGMNNPEQGHGSIVLAYKWADGTIGVVNHESHKDFKGDWQHKEPWTNFTKDQIAHLARHAGLKLAE